MEYKPPKPTPTIQDPKIIHYSTIVDRQGYGLDQGLRFGVYGLLLRLQGYVSENQAGRLSLGRKQRKLWLKLKLLYTSPDLFRRSPTPTGLQGLEFGACPEGFCDKFTTC